MSDGVEEDDKHEKKNECEVDDERDEDVVPTIYIKFKDHIAWIIDLEELSNDEDGEEEYTDLIFEGLFSCVPAEGNDDVLESDNPEDDCFEVDDILSNVVVLPVEDGEYQQYQCYDCLYYFEYMVLQHVILYLLSPLFKITSLLLSPIFD